LKEHAPWGREIVSLDGLSDDAEPLGEVLDWVGAEFGLIRALWAKRLLPPQPRWWVCGAELARAPIGTLTARYSVTAAGASISSQEALQRVLGEALERYCAFNAVALDELERRPLHDCVLLDHFARCADEEPCADSLKLHGLRAELPVTQSSVLRLSDGRSHFVPATQLHLGFRQPDDEPLLALPTSTGMAFHRTVLEALWRGLCEAAERDALMILWWSRTVPPLILCDGPDTPAELVERLDLLEDVELRARLFDMTTDFRVPTVLALISSEHYPYSTVGAACAADPGIACASALDEAVAVRTGVSWKEEMWDPPSLETFDWIRQLEDHSNLYAAWKDTPAFSFLSKAKSLPFQEFRQRDWWQQPTDDREFRALARQLEQMDLTVLWKDITLPDVRQLGVAVKVLVPQMVPLSFDHHVRWLATPRLQRIGRLSKRKAGLDGYNRYPHPFA
jgi:ribosomal protein S12 methylthiotransferase accessory factor